MVYSLSIHADYRCRHSGQCCSTHWDVPVELPIYTSLTDALASGRLRVAAHASTLAPFVVEPGLPDEAAAIFERTEAGQCVFFERQSNLCIVHRDLGTSALPATCRYFPRVAVRDARGTFIGLSHFCPTAASLLFREDVPVEIVSAPPAFPPADYEGLVVGADELPPLLHPQMLMGLDGYAAWERHMVSRCADPALAPEAVLRTLERDARLLRGWRPAEGPLPGAIDELPRHGEAPGPPERLERSLAHHAGVMAAVPDEIRPDADEEGLPEAFERWVHPAWTQFQAPLNRYLAAKAFANWTAYQGRGVLSVVRGLDAALALVRVEAARQCRDAGCQMDAALLLEAFRGADFALNHLAVGDELAARWSAAEED